MCGFGAFCSCATEIEQLICSQVNEDNKEKGAGRIEHANAW